MRCKACNIIFEPTTNSKLEEEDYCSYCEDAILLAIFEREEMDKVKEEEEDETTPALPY